MGEYWVQDHEWADLVAVIDGKLGRPAVYPGEGVPEDWSTRLLDHDWRVINTGDSRPDLAVLVREMDWFQSAE